jgi:hypothetical protein
VVEYYPENLPLGMFLPATKQPLYKVLDSLQMAKLTWEYGGGVVRIRPTDWAVQRSYDVPESFLETYRKILKDKGYFDLDDLAAVSASLTDGQIQHRFIADKEIGLAGSGLISLGSGRTLLRLYGELTPDQKAQMKSPDGLTFDRLNESQWQRVATVIQEDDEGAEIGAGRIQLAVQENKLPDLESGNPGKGDDNADSDPPEDKPKANAEKPNSSDAKAKGEESPPEPDPTIRNAIFTLEVEGENGDKPQVLTRSINIPSKAQIARIKNQVAQMQKDQEKQQEEQPEEKAAEKKPAASSKPAAKGPDQK